MIWLVQILKILSRRTASEKALCDNAFNIAKNSNYDGNEHGLASMAYKYYKF